MMNVLIIGNGGREHAIYKALQKRSLKYPIENIKIDHISETPNVGMLGGNNKHYTTLDEYKESNQIPPTFAFIGPERYLKDDIASQLTCPCIGPPAQLAQIETSKIFCREFLKTIGLNKYSPKFFVHKTYNKKSTDESMRELNDNFVIKANGLHSGKGVKVHFKDNQEAHDFARNLRSAYLVEERLYGYEFSLMSFSDGIKLEHMPFVQDFKQLYKDGPNTGGMGSIYYPESYTKSINNYIKEAQLLNSLVVSNLQDKYNTKYIGVIYGSYMITNDNELKIIEYNARPGDSEFINILHAMKTPFIDTCLDLISNDIRPITYSTVPNVYKYLVPPNYPNKDPKNLHIQLPITQSELNGLDVIISGINISHFSPNTLETSGSRMLGVINENHDINKSIKIIDNTFNNINKRLKNDFYYRKDIYPNPSLKDPNHKQSYEYINEKSVTSILHDLRLNIHRTHNKNTIASSKSYAGIYDNMAITMDGVGTKSILVKEYFDSNTAMTILATDLFNCNINDLLCIGKIKPTYFLDYYGSNETNVSYLEPFLKQLCKLCESHNCSLLGGETAIMNDIYHNNISLIGVMAGEVISKYEHSNIKSGDYIIGLKSSGPHTNGYTLIRQIIKNNKHNKHNKHANISNEFIQNLCKPHKNYYDDIEKFNKSYNINGVVHITGGGFDNIKRVLNKTINANINTCAWETPSLFKWIEEHNINNIYSVFNMGIGMVIITDELPSFDILENINGVVIGSINEGNGEVIMNDK